MNARRSIPNGGHRPPQRRSSRRIWCLWVVIAMWPLSWVVFMHGAVTNHFNQYNVVDDETFRNEQRSSSTYQNTARTRELTTNKNSSSPPGVELTASSSSVTPEKTQPNTTAIEKANPATTNSKPSLPKTVLAVDTDSTATKDATAAITATATATTTTTTSREAKAEATSSSTASNHDADDNENNANGSAQTTKDTRPWLILHVGPPKTATTTIQDGLLEMAEQMARDDNIYFLGGTLHKRKDVPIRGSSASNFSTPSDFTVFRIIDLIPYGQGRTWTKRINYVEFSKALREHQKLGHNVVLSDELYTSAPFMNWTKLYDGTFLRANNIGRDPSADPTRTSDESSFGFRIKVVVGYRHFFQWLPSIYYQDYLLLPGKFADPKGDPEKFANLHTPGLIEFIRSSLDAVVQYDPSYEDENNHIFATVDKTEFKEHTQVIDGIHAPLWIYLKFATRPEFADRVDVFDLLQQEIGRDADGNNEKDEDSSVNSHRHGLFTDFVCQILPSANHTCTHLLENENVANATTNQDRLARRSSKNKDLVSIADRHRVTQQARLDPMLNSTLDLYFGGPPQTDLHNAVESWFANETGRVEAFQTCMDRSLVERFKIVSWNFLVQLYLLTKHRSSLSDGRQHHSHADSLFDSSTPTDRLLFSHQSHVANYPDNKDTNIWLARTKIEHDRAFEEFVGEGTPSNPSKICQLDTEALLADPGFYDYYSKIKQRPPRKKKTKKTKGMNNGASTTDHPGLAKTNTEQTEGLAICDETDVSSFSETELQVWEERCAGSSADAKDAR